MAGRVSSLCRVVARLVVVRVLGGCALVLGAGAARAQKADSVWIRNGDRIVGEVKSLTRGLLTYSTDDLGTIKIEWDKVSRISTRTILEVQLSAGPKFYGPLGLGPPRTLVLGGDTLALIEIVAMTPIKRTRLNRIDGYLDLGFTYQKANNSTQLTTGARVLYRSPATETVFEIDAFQEDRDDAEGTERVSTALTERLLLANRWSAGALVGFDQNEELDLAGRWRLVGFGGRTFSETNHVQLSGIGGIVLTTERYFSTDSSSAGFEGLVGGVYRAFRYDRPKLDASVTAQLFPSLSVAGRIRTQSDVRVSYELVKDFMLTVRLFSTTDSKPQSADAAKRDFGSTLSISWTF